VRLREIHVRTVTQGSREAVYRLLTDGPTWPTWSPIDSFELERPGDPPPEGVGAIRRFRRGRTTGRDQILELVPNRSITYASLSGLPIRNYVATVDVEAAPGGGTTIHWHSSFFPKMPGTGYPVERSLRRFLERCTHRLARHAASSSDTSAM